MVKLLAPQIRDLKLDRLFHNAFESIPWGPEVFKVLQAPTPSNSLEQLIKEVLRKAPDHIIIGECLELESIELLQAMNSGHDNSMITFH